MAESTPSRSSLALIANSQEWSSRSLESLLAPHGYAVLKAYTGAQAVKLARETSPDFIIVDMGLPDSSGFEVCNQIHEDPRISDYTPILLTTAGRLTREARLKALSAGAWDFVALPLDSEELLLRLTSYMRLKFEADRIQEESLVDHLTGLYNLRGLMRRVRELGSDAFRNGRSMACVAFAPFTGTTSELSEQELWQTVHNLATIFRSSGRVSDAIGRIRLAEFVVIAPGTDESGALKLAERIIASIEAKQNGGVAPNQMRAGYYGIMNLRESGSQPAALLAGATTALRQVQSEANGSPIRRFETNGDRL